MNNSKFGETIRGLRTARGFRQQEVLRRLNGMGIETSKNQVSRWENGYNKPNIEQFLGLCRIYEVADPFLLFVGHDETELKTGLNADGRARLREYRELLLGDSRFREETEAPKPVIILPLRRLPEYEQRVSAGCGNFLDDGAFTMVDVPEEVPANADFALRICGDSMEPTLHDGQRIWISGKTDLKPGELGVFYVDGETFVKEYSRDGETAVLISHNPFYPPRRVCDPNAKILGRVIWAEQ